MAKQDDWRLLNEVQHLKKAEWNPTDGEELAKHAPHLHRCAFCLEQVQDSPYQRWLVLPDLSCCVCAACYGDFEELFEWKQLDGWDIAWDRG